MTVCINIYLLGIVIYLLIGLAFSSVIFAQNKKTMGSWRALILGIVVGIFWLIFVILVPIFRYTQKEGASDENSS